jgi:hypothetical protein
MCDRFLLNYLKAELRKHTFQSQIEVEAAALQCLREVPEEASQHEVQKLYDHSQDIINAKGA